MSDRELKLKVHFEAFDKLTGPLRGMFDGAGKASGKLKELTQIAKLQRREMRELQDSMSGASGSITTLLDHEKRLQTQLDRTNDQIARQVHLRERQSRMKAVGAQAMQIGAGATAAGVVAAMPIVSATRDAMAFESAMADVRKVTDFSAAGWEEYNQHILDLHTQIPGALADLAQISAAAATGGIGADAMSAGNEALAQSQLLDFTKIASQMAIAYDTSATEAGNMMRGWSASLRMPQAELEKTANQVNALSDISHGGDAREIGEIITNVGALTGMMNTAGQSVAAMGALVSDARVPVDRAGTSIKHLLMGLAVGEDATDRQSEAFGRLGLNATDVAKRLQADSEGTILDVLKRIKTLPKELQVPTISSLFGREGIDGVGVLISNSDLLARNFAFLGDETNYANSMQTEFFKRIATAEGATGLFKNGLRAINVELGQQLAPLLAQIATNMQPVLKSIREWINKHPKLTQGIMLFIAAIAGLLLIGGPLLIGIGAMAWAFGALGVTTFGALVPFLLIAAAIAAIIAIGVLLVQNWGAISAWWGEMTKGLGDNFKKNFWLGLVTLPGQMAQFGLNLLGSLAKGILDALPKVWDAVKNVAGAIKDAFMKSLEIHSPSRVFRGYGEFVNQGFVLGLQDTMQKPIAMAGRIAAAVAAAGMVGTGAMAAPNQIGGGTAAGGFSIGNVTIQINQMPGQSSQDLAVLVRQEIEKLASQTAARARSAYRDE
ncbi:MAG: putative phage-related membrane protein [Hyphomonadaceae bacterium]|nr:MAG: putative phage-related membrane protein [Hyphomonadaceae bacterium]